jgi:hypothetical protein
MPINSFLYPGVKVTPVFEVANSLRFDSASNDSLSRTTGSSPTSTTKGTFSLWLKRSKLGANDRFITTNGVSDPYFQIYFDSNASRLNKIRLQVYDGGSSRLELVTNQVFRDTSSWYNIILSYDSTPSTPSSSSIKLFINGTQVTSFQTETYPSQNQNHRFNEGVMRISSYDGSNDNSDAYMSEIVYCDGQALDADSFGEFDEDTGIWKPIDVSGLTFGAKGFYLDFEDSSALGNDVSGNNNDFTVNNLTSIDQTTDTCTNNFATINSLDNLYTGGTLSEGNTKIVTGVSNEPVYINSTIGVASGKWYCEVKNLTPSGRGLTIGISGRFCSSSNDSLGSDLDGFGYTQTGVYRNNNSTTSYGNSYTENDIIGIALDLDNNKLYFSKNGTWQNSGDPTSGATGTGAISIGTPSTGFYFISLGDNSGDTTTFQTNFGNPSFSISSGNSDGNGYGNFEYSVPSGYYALNTKNLAEYG